MRLKLHLARERVEKKMRILSVSILLALFGFSILLSIFHILNIFCEFLPAPSDGLIGILPVQVKLLHHQFASGAEGLFLIYRA